MISLDGVLDEFEEFFSSRATFSSSCRTVLINHFPAHCLDTDSGRANFVTSSTKHTC